MSAARWSGRLKDHFGPCWRDHAADEECWVCGWRRGRRDVGVRWDSWYQWDVGDCDGCHAEDVPVSEYYDSPSPSDDGWRCLPCVLAEHRRGCNCELWREAEDELRAVRRDGET